MGSILRLVRRRQEGLGEADMSDLTEYDREIVAAAELWAERESTSSFPERSAKAAKALLLQAVQAKQKAQQPTCDWVVFGGTCKNRAVQAISQPQGGPLIYRCDEHRIEVREL